MNPNLDQLQPYPFEKLQALKSGLTPPAALSPIYLSIGAPKHAAPEWLKQTLIEHLDDIAHYPATRGIPALREAICTWLIQRYGLPADSLDPEQHVLPVSGTREALFAIAQTLIQPTPAPPMVLMPNPFYQIYEGAALLAHAQPYFLNTTAETHFIPDFAAVPESIWAHCQLLYLCTPGNPAGAVMPEETLAHVLNLAEQYDFIIACDECYSEIYPDEHCPPMGLLQAANNLGNTDYKRCLVFNSLSKRSNVPGLRSGFVAGDAELIRRFHQYRTYQGCTLPVPTQKASIAAWQDETHVRDNRTQYREKFAKVLAILSPVLDVYEPDAGFYLWPKVPIDDTTFTQGLYQTQNVTVLPGQYLSREAQGINPGQQHVRMALVATTEECVEAAHRIKHYITSL